MALHISDDFLTTTVNLTGALIFILIIAYHWIDVNGGRVAEKSS
jgi:ABC-type Co2+ transport system permease subunit